MLVSNSDYLIDNELSLGAKGLYGIFKKFENEKISISDLLKYCNNGEAACKRFIKELLEKGYVKREMIRGDDGRMQRIKYVLPDKVLKFSNNKSGTLGFVYLFFKEGLYKIGITQNISNRARAIKGSSKSFNIVCYEKVENYIKKETELHEYFKSKNVKGEWFNLDVNDVEYIKQKLNQWKIDYVKPQKKIKYMI